MDVQSDSKDVVELIQQGMYAVELIHVLTLLMLLIGDIVPPMEVSLSYFIENATKLPMLSKDMGSR